MWIRAVWYIFPNSGEHSTHISYPKVEGRVLKWKAVNYLPVYTWSHTRSHRPEILKSHTDAWKLMWRAEASVSRLSRHGNFHPLLQIIMKFLWALRNGLQSPNEYANWLLASWFLDTRPCPRHTDAGRIPVLRTLNRVPFSKCLLVIRVVITA